VVSALFVVQRKGSMKIESAGFITRESIKIRGWSKSYRYSIPENIIKKR